MIIKRVTERALKIVAPYLAPKVAHSILFYLSHRYWMDWKNPQTFDEKITFAMTCLIGEREAIYADKYRVRKILAEMGFASYLPKVYGAWKNASEIEFDTLPNQFVLKTNNGYSERFNWICLNKQFANLESIRRKFESALRTPFWKAQCEYHYRYIDPLIFAEEYLNDNSGERPLDYKIFCFSGKPLYIMLCSNRGIDLKLDFYDLNWNYVGIASEEKRSGKQFPKPEGLNTMLSISERISSAFPTVRIDFYDIHGKVYIGEITLTSFAGNNPITTEWQYKFGELVDLSSCKAGFLL